MKKTSIRSTLKSQAPRRIKSILREAAALRDLKGFWAPNLWVTVAWVSAPQMKRLNADYRGVQKETDILSFPAPPIHRGEGFLGELVICERVLKRQAKERELTSEMELMILLVHGFLHLLGFDHEKSKREALRMADLETRLLKRVVPKSWISRTHGNCLLGLIERVEN